MSIIETRLRDLDTITLRSGSHRSFDEGACLLEAASWVAGEPFSAYPECVCPVIAAFGRAWNDALPADDRNRLLKPLIPLIIGTRSTPEVRDARAFMAADWAVRVFTPAWLRLAGLAEDAVALESLPELSSVETCRAAMPAIATAKDAAWAAGEAAGLAGEAAWAAAGAAAGEAARAAWAAAGAADGAAGAAARAAWAAARYAAGAAAGDALEDTKRDFQQSALDLLHRMIAVTPESGRMSTPSPAWTPNNGTAEKENH